MRHIVGELKQGKLGDAVSKLAESFADILLRFAKIVTSCFVRQYYVKGKIR